MNPLFLLAVALVVFGYCAMSTYTNWRTGDFWMAAWGGVSLLGSSVFLVVCVLQLVAMNLS